MTRDKNKKQILAWALYDWGNSAFATAVMAGFFPVFFKQYWSHGLSVTESTLRLGIANSAASLVIVVLAPVLGAIADRGRSRKRFLAGFTVLGVAMSAALYFVARGDWLTAAVVYAAATVGFSGGMTFYDSLLVGVAGPDDNDRVSAFGYALGYLGGGLMFAGCVAMTLWPHSFGLADAAAAVRLSFVLVALWWAAFTVPLLRHVPEPPGPPRASGEGVMVSGFRQLFHTLREVRRLRVVALFLLGYWLYIDGVDTIVRMAVDYGLSLGFEANSLIVALLITQFVGFPAALAFGVLGERIGSKRAILLAIAVYIAVVVWARGMTSVREFYVLAVVVGLVQGGIQSLSRSFYARIIPAQKTAEFFGFYNMLGKFSVVIGPVLMGWVAHLTGSNRQAMLSIIVLFVLGGVLLWRVDEAEGRRMASALAPD